MNAWAFVDRALEETGLRLTLGEVLFESESATPIAVAETAVVATAASALLGIVFVAGALLLALEAVEKRFG